LPAPLAAQDFTYIFRLKLSSAEEKAPSFLVMFNIFGHSQPALRNNMRTLQLAWINASRLSKTVKLAQREKNSLPVLFASPVSST
jgi:hypothetical protein